MTEALLADIFPGAVGTGRALADAGWTVAVAESCTGGLLGAALTAVDGSSAWVRGGVVAYANDIKIALLGVDAADLEAHGAVSETVACQMAEGVRTRLGATVGVGITGVAGPTGGTDAKPVGLIWIAVTGPTVTRTRAIRDDHGREANRAGAVRCALELLRELAERV